VVNFHLPGRTTAGRGNTHSLFRELYALILIDALQ
jgi:hypothetical protein